MANYVDGFVIPVPKKNVEDYVKLAKKAAKIWLEHGALEYIECIEDDVKKGKRTSFPQSVKRKSGEVIFFSWIVYKSRKHRDKVLEKVMSDHRLQKEMKNMPFDGKRMIWGGFKTVVSMEAKNA